jgi:hypothetical protein
LEKDMSELHLVPSTAPDIPDDEFLAALEARLIFLIAETLLDFNAKTDSLPAYVLAEARDIYLDRNKLPVTVIAEHYVGRLHRHLRTLSPESLTRLRHPAWFRDRAAMQPILEGKVAGE